MKDYCIGILLRMTLQRSRPGCLSSTRSTMTNTDVGNNLRRIGAEAVRSRIGRIVHDQDSLTFRKDSTFRLDSTDTDFGAAEVTHNGNSVRKDGKH